MESKNQQWHEQHKMPGSPTPLERLAWHEAHRKNCGCHRIPNNVFRSMPPGSEQD
jgi:hypothetical protein